MATTNQWDELADIFGQTETSDKGIPETAADNIFIAWPSILHGIENNLSTSHNPAALDFGCGGGLFCQKLHSLGYQVTGYEPSAELAMLAQQQVPDEVIIGQAQDVFGKSRYQLITSIMVLQFVEEIEDTIAMLANSLSRDGILIYAVFNPAFVYDNMARQQLFTPGDKQDLAYMELKPGVNIPFTVRAAADYRALFEKYGMKECYSDLPPFTASFIDQYGIKFSTQHSEFLIQAFRFDGQH